MNGLDAQSPENSGVRWASASLAFGILATGASAFPFLDYLIQLPGTLLLWIASVVSFLILQPLLPVVGIVCATRGLLRESARGVAIAGIVLCALNELFFIGEFIYVMNFTQFLRGMIG